MMSRLLYHDAGIWSEPDTDALIVGRKAIGLAALPPDWRPPLVVLPSTAFSVWLAADESSRADILEEASGLIADAARAWDNEWSYGIILRSSGSAETMNDRGQHQSLRLARDFSREQIRVTLNGMYKDFAEQSATGSLAVVIQPTIKGEMGHLSNERRVSITVNQWEWERTHPSFSSGRINSQRDAIPSTSSPLHSSSEPQTKRLFGGVGKWLNSLDKGPAHIEWIHDGSRLWLVQLDFELEMPDAGHDPRVWLREADDQNKSEVPSISPFHLVDALSGCSPWRKIAKLKALAAQRKNAYPKLVTITGDQLERSLAAGYNLASDLQGFANGRVVCRTDCISKTIKGENLPRTPTVSSVSAIDEMQKFLVKLKGDGARADEVCFILHKFLPAQAGAWVKADPTSNVVKIDSLWGVPDGLQYLPHDTFEFDVGSNTILAEHIRYKPKFIQEDIDGSWRELTVKRTLGRAQSLIKADIEELATTSHRIAIDLNEPVLIMWFCGIPSGLSVGRNIPWFRMKPNPKLLLQSPAGTSRWPKRYVRTVADIDELEINLKRHILVLEPVVDLIRDDKHFLERIAQFAKSNSLPVEMSGSTLAHAFYMLEKEGISVLPTGDRKRQRSRGRKTFDKLVRDNLPDRIEQRGEVVVRSKLVRSEMRQALVGKLFEEAQELLSARDPDDVKAEIADLLEVVRALASATGVDWTEVQQTADAKRLQRGGFDAGEVLVETTLPASEPPTVHAPTYVSLRQLGRVINKGTQSTVSYNALLAGLGKGVEIVIGGQTFKVTLQPEGVEVSRSAAVGAAPQQLTLL